MQYRDKSEKALKFKCLPDRTLDLHDCKQPTYTHANSHNPAILAVEYDSTIFLSVRLADSDRLRASDEIAAIMGHEISHTLRERASQALGTQLGIALVGISAGANLTQMNLAGNMSKYLYLLTNSREHETDADRMGVKLVARAGYDPRTAISVWHKMHGMGSRQPPQFMSTDPSHATRIDRSVKPIRLR